MAHNLALTVVAEGVETAEQLTFLRRAGCDGLQGFLLCAPLSAHEASALLREPACEQDASACSSA
jgi:EAL domain-containing protein (putative c-di-GMP-specific phosphodiesterase class I)